MMECFWYKWQARLRIILYPQETQEKKIDGFFIVEHRIKLLILDSLLIVPIKMGQWSWKIIYKSWSSADHTTRSTWENAYKKNVVDIINLIKHLQVNLDANINPSTIVTDVKDMGDIMEMNAFCVTNIQKVDPEIQAVSPNIYFITSNSTTNLY